MTIETGRLLAAAQRALSAWQRTCSGERAYKRTYPLAREVTEGEVDVTFRLLRLAKSADFAA
jgi:hypothetical protein